MPASRKQKALKSSAEESQVRTIGARKSGKMEGTRVGVMVDWRGAGTRRTGETSGLGKSLRDGR
jgi:hypothetical protein